MKRIGLYLCIVAFLGIYSDCIGRDDADNAPRQSVQGNDYRLPVEAKKRIAALHRQVFDTPNCTVSLAPELDVTEDQVSIPQKTVEALLSSDQERRREVELRLARTFARTVVDPFRRHQERLIAGKEVTGGVVTYAVSLITIFCWKEFYMAGQFGMIAAGILFPARFFTKQERNEDRARLAADILITTRGDPEISNRLLRNARAAEEQDDGHSQKAFAILCIASKQKSISPKECWELSAGVY